MNKIRLFSILTFLVAVALAIYLGYSIYKPMKQKELIASEEAKVIEKLEMIRKAQKAYFKEINDYAGTWNELVSWVDTGKIYEIQRKEQVFERQIEKAYLGDSILVTYDTLGIYPAEEHVFPDEEYPDFEPEKLPYVPGRNYKFKLETSTILMGRTDVPVIKVVDPYPINPIRDPDDENRLNWPLQFGSLQEATTDGNWK